MSVALEQVQVLDREAGRFVFLGWRNITIAVWTAQPIAAAVLRLAQVGKARLKEHPMLSDIHLVIGHIGLPDAETRAALIAESQHAVPQLAAVAIVLGGDGFWASAFRGFVTGVHVLVRDKFELKLFASAQDVAAWLPRVHESKSGVKIDAPELAAVLQHALAVATEA